MKKIVLFFIIVSGLFCCANAQKKDISNKNICADAQKKQKKSIGEKYITIKVNHDGDSTRLDTFTTDAINLIGTLRTGKKYESSEEKITYWSDGLDYYINKKPYIEIRIGVDDPACYMTLCHMYVEKYNLHNIKRLDIINDKYIQETEALHLHLNGTQSWEYEGDKSNRKLMQTGNDSIFLNLSTDDRLYLRSIKLPFDNLAFDFAQDKFFNQEIEDEDMPATLYYIRDNKILKRIYENTYNDKSVIAYLPFVNPKGVSFFILYAEKTRDKIITYKNNHIVDRLLLQYIDHKIPIGCEITFTISKDYIVTLYKNKFTKSEKMIEHKPFAKYKINEDGKFVKID